MLAIPILANAAPARGFVEVDNQFEGEVEVFVDGRFVGVVPGDRALRFDLAPGRHDLVARRPRGGVELLATAIHGHPGATVVVPVHTPTSRLRVTNAGALPLSVDLGPGDDVWIGPRSAVEVSVPAGTVYLLASAKDHDGLTRVHEERLWVEPGPRTERVLEYDPPPPTRLSLHNRDRDLLRAVVDGREVGWVAPGEQRSVHVDPGWTHIRFYDPRGRLVSAMDIRAERGKQTPVVVAGAPRAADTCSVPSRLSRR